MTKIQIYSPVSTPALHYICDFIFVQFLGLDLCIINNISQINESAALINYSDEQVENSLQIIPNGYLMSASFLNYPSVKLDLWNGLPIFFKTGGDVPFDLFSAAFFLLTRAEEYKPAELDSHGRFSYGNSVFADTEIVSRPIVDEWIITLATALSNQFGVKQFSRKFNWINTIDIDVAYAFRGRSILRTAGAAARDLFFIRWKNFTSRMFTLLHLQKDPFDTYRLQKQIADKIPSTNTKYFFLLAKRAKYDNGLAPRSGVLKKLIGCIDAFAEVGIHPSYASNSSPSILKKELKLLSDICKRPITISRNHFLKVQIPETFNTLLDYGIKEDYSLGYACTPGFRAGTCTPFFFFDLYRNCQTSLRIVPLIVMDASLKNYAKLSTDEAKAKIYNLVKQVKAVNGTFVSLWHNDTISNHGDWKGWREVYLQMVADVEAVQDH